MEVLIMDSIRSVRGSENLTVHNGVHQEVSNDSRVLEKKSEGPADYGWFSLGQGRGIKWTLWKTSVTFQRQEKQGDKWITLEELHVAPKVLKEVSWRCPGWLSVIEGGSGKDSE
jgi:hypothetical protein